MSSARSSVFTLSAGLCLSVLSCNLSSAQDNLSYQERAEKAYDENNLPEAIKIALEGMDKLSVDSGITSFAYAELMHDAGLYYFFNNERETGIDYLKTATEIIRDFLGTRHPRYCGMYSDLGVVYHMNGEYRKALEVFERTTALARDAGGAQSAEYANEANKLGLVLASLGRYDEAQSYYGQSMANFELHDMKDTPEYGSLLSNYADCLTRLGDRAKALELLEQAAAILKSTEGTNGSNYTTAMQNMGLLYVDLLQYDKAREIFMEVLEIRKALYGEESAEYALSLNDIANLDQKEGNYIESERAYVKAVEINKNTVGTGSLTYMNTVSNLASVYMDLGRYEEAVDLLNPIVVDNAARAAEFPLDYARFVQNEAMAFQHLGELETAEKMFEGALVIHKAVLGNDNRENVYIINNLAGLKVMQDKFKEAQKLYLEALDILQRTGQDKSGDDYILGNYHIGLNYMNMGQFKKAVPYMEEAAAQAPLAYGIYHPYYLAIANNAGFMYDSLNRPVEAKKYFLLSLDAYEKAIYENFDAMPMEEKIRYRDDLKLHMAAFNKFVVRNYRQDASLIAKMYEYRVAVKSMILNSTAGIRKQIMASGNTALLEKYEAWNNNKATLNALYTFSKSDLEREGYDADSLKKATDLMGKEIALESTAFSDSRKRAAITWEDVRDHLAPGEAAVELNRVAFYGQNKNQIDKYYVAMIIKSNTTGQPEFALTNNGRALDEELSDRFYDLLLHDKSDDESYGHFWSWIAARLEGIERIYISLDGIYNIINVNTFKNPATGHYVIDDLDVRIVGNTKDIIRLKAHGPEGNRLANGKSATLIGYPNYYKNLIDEIGGKEELMAMNRDNTRTFQREYQYVMELPGTKTEVALIDEILRSAGWQTEVYLDDEATEKKVKNLKRSSVLHIATHGFYDWQYEGDEAMEETRVDRSVSLKDPLFRSGLLLAGAGYVVKLLEGNVSTLNNMDDGILSAFEVTNLDLQQTDLVVLSACLSKIGDTRLNDTEGFAGLLQAFLIAGAKSVIASNWSVDDQATQELMTLFYRNLTVNPDKAKALRDAQLELKTRFPGPMYWGPFVLVGA